MSILRSHETSAVRKSRSKYPRLAKSLWNHHNTLIYTPSEALLITISLFLANVLVVHGPTGFVQYNSSGSKLQPDASYFIQKLK